MKTLRAPGFRNEGGLFLRGRMTASTWLLVAANLFAQSDTVDDRKNVCSRRGGLYEFALSYLYFLHSWLKKPQPYCSNNH